MTYVDTIEPRLTPPRPSHPSDPSGVLTDWCADLLQELKARLELVTTEYLCWQPHPDSNSAGVTVWHVARWVDVLGTRTFTGAPVAHDVWHTGGWRAATGYEPDGLGYAGLGTLTGYTPEQMRAVPVLDADDLSEYLSQSAARLLEQITALSDSVVNTPVGHGLSPYQTIGCTLQGSFGHIGEIDTLVALRARLGSG